MQDLLAVPRRKAECVLLGRSGRPLFGDAVSIVINVREDCADRRTKEEVLSTLSGPGEFNHNWSSYHSISFFLVLSTLSGPGEFNHNLSS
jgi:hypothetical protein